jgi:hypothetical protein
MAERRAGLVRLMERGCGPDPSWSRQNGRFNFSGAIWGAKAIFGSVLTVYSAPGCAIMVLKLVLA